MTRREPRPGLAARLKAVEDATLEVRDAEDDLQQARGRLRDALREAVEEGASYAQLGRITGLSRERVSQIVRGEN